MRITADQMIAGFPAKDLRKALKRHGGWRLDPGQVAFDLSQPEETAGEIMSRLEAAGLVSRDESGPGSGFWITTIEGNALAMASMRKPTSRKNADKILNEFLQRVEQVNTSEDFLYSVEKVLLFGSYLDPSIDTVNDIDLCLWLNRKEADWDKFCALSDQRVQVAVDAGRDLSDFMKRLFWPETEVMRFLKKRSPVLSFVKNDDEVLTRAKTKIIFESSGT